MMKTLFEYSSRFRILKGGKISLVVSAFLAGSTLLNAAPIGGTLTSGSASISQIGGVTNITQSTSKASINWQSFNIAPSESVNFIQPSASSVTLNRVTGATNSLIQGALNANGQVILVNPNGIVFTEGSTVNVGGLIATTRNITDQDFNSNNYVFEGDSSGGILNQATINAKYVAMMGKDVVNEGTIVATLGRVELASGDRFTLNLNGDSLLSLHIDEGTLNALVENRGLIKADGGVVYLTTQALDSILDGMVNNTGVIEAQSLSNQNGEIVLFAHGGTANIGGEIKAEGGFVETSGKEFAFQAGTNVQAAHWLIDPTDITIDQAMADGFVTTLNSGGDVTVTTASGDSETGNITIEDDVTIAKTAGDESTLTLRADSAILVGSDVTISSTSDKLNVYISAMNGDTTASTSLEGDLTDFYTDYYYDFEVYNADDGTYSYDGALDVDRDLQKNIVIKDNFNLTTNNGDFIVGAALDGNGIPTADSDYQPNVIFQADRSGALGDAGFDEANTNIDTGTGDIKIWGYDILADGHNYTFSGNNVDFYAGSQLLLIGRYSAIDFADDTIVEIGHRGLQITAADTLSFRAVDALDIHGTYAPSNGEAYITPQSKSFLKAENEILFENINADIFGGSKLYNLSIELTGSGNNKLTFKQDIWSYNSIYSWFNNATSEENNYFNIEDVSVTFAGTPDLNFEFGASAYKFTYGYNYSYELVLQEGPEEIDVDDGYDSALPLLKDKFLNTGGSHFALNGEDYTFKFINGNPDAPEITTVTPNVLDNGYFAAGDGLSAPINSVGNLAQPFYYDSTIGRWFKLTYEDYDFNLVLGVGADPVADEAGNWNSHGQILWDTYDFEDIISNVIYDYSGLSGGVGTAKVTYELATDEGNVRISQDFTLEADGKFIKGVTKLENIEGTDIQNARMWIGTEDDWVAITDSNVKTKGNLTENGFEVLDNQDEQARAVIISEFDWVNGDTDGSAVIYHSTNEDADTITADDYDMELVYGEDPRTSPIVTPKEDGAYGVYMNFGDVPNAATREVTWYYGVAPVTEINTLVAQMVADGALNVASPIPPVVTPPPASELTPEQEVEIKQKEETVQEIVTAIVNNAMLNNAKPSTQLQTQQQNPQDAFGKRVESTLLSKAPEIGNDKNLGSVALGLDGTIRSVSPAAANASKDKKLTVVGQTSGETEITKIELDELLAQSGGGELRVALSPDSFIELVNGGLNLPDDVSQEFYVVEDKE